MAGCDLAKQLERLTDYQCQSRNSPGFDPTIFWHIGIWGAAHESVLNIVPYIKIYPPFKYFILTFFDD